MIEPPEIAASAPAERRPARAGARGEMLLVALLAVVCAAVSARVDASLPRITAGLLLELVLPGYALSALVFAAAVSSVSPGAR